MHYSQVIGTGFKTLEDGAVVEFEMKHGDKGLQAENVVLLEEQSA